MAISLMQKIKLGLKGWSRRRSADSLRRNEEFLTKQIKWGSKPATPEDSKPAVPSTSRPSIEVDREGLQVAYLDDSGQLNHFLDRESGEVLDVAFTDEAGIRAAKGNPVRFRLIPRRSAESDASDRLRFARSLDDCSERSPLIAAAGLAAEYRKLLSANRTIERAWYNFKNDEASKVIEAWLMDDAKASGGKPQT